MKFTTISVAVAAMLVSAQSAQAREHYRHHRYHAAHFVRHYSSPRRGDYAGRNMFAEHGRGYFGQSDFAENYADQVYPQRSAYGGQFGAHVGGRPAAGGGWGMRARVFREPGPAFNTAGHL